MQERYFHESDLAIPRINLEQVEAHIAITELGDQIEKPKPKPKFEHDLAGETTWHGVPYIITAEPDRPDHREFWIAVVGLCVFAFAVCAGLLFWEFAERPKVIVQEFKRPKHGAMMLPKTVDDRICLEDI